MELFQSTAFCVWPLVGRSSNIQNRIGNLGLEQRQQEVRNPRSSKSSSSVSTKADYYYYEDDDDSEAEEADTNKKLQKMKSDELDWAARARQLAIQDMRIRNFTDQDFEALLPPHLRLTQKMKKKKKTTKKKKKETVINELQSSSSALKSKTMKPKKTENVVSVEDQEVEAVDPEQLKALVRKFNSRRDRYLDCEDEQGEEEDDMQQLSVVYADLQKSDEDDEFFLSDSDEDEAPVVRKDPKLSEIHLNQDLVEARDVDEVLDAVSRAKERKIELSEINIATALHRIAKHMVSASMHESRRLTYARQSDISQLVASAVELLPGCGAQAISNIAWALSKIGGSLLYVGEMEVLSRVAEAKADDMNSQNVANVAGAFATMQHSSPDLFRKLGIRASVLASEFKAQEIVQLLWSFACLGLSRESVEPFLDALDKGVDDKESEGGDEDDDEFSFDLLCSVAWSYAVFGDLQRSFFRKICGKIKSFDGDTSIGQHRNLRQLTQLYQVMLAMKLEEGEDGGLVFGDRMQKLAAAAWEKERSSKKATSFLQKDMERFLVCTGRKWIPEFVDSEYSLDFACADGKVAIEVNGPSHYARNTGELLGHTMLKHRLLTVAGWKVILASYAEWEDLDGESEHVEFLQKLVKPHFS